MLLKKVFLFKCTIPVLRMNNLLLNLLLPPLISHCLALYRSDRPPRTLLQPTFESIAISAFPVAWFFSFLYYTELGSVFFVLATVLAAGRGAHMLAAMVSIANMSCCIDSYLSLNPIRWAPSVAPFARQT